MTAGKQSEQDPLNNKLTSSAASDKQIPSALRVRRPFGTTRLRNTASMAPVTPPNQAIGEIQSGLQQAQPLEPVARLDVPAPIAETPVIDSFSSGKTSALEELAKLFPLKSAMPVVEQPSGVSGPMTPLSFNQVEDRQPKVENPVTPLPVPAPWSSVLWENHAEGRRQKIEDPVTPLPVATAWQSNIRVDQAEESSSKKGSLARPLTLWLQNLKVTKDLSFLQQRLPFLKRNQAQALQLSAPGEKTPDAILPVNTSASQNNPTTLLPETNHGMTVRLPESSFTGILPLQATDANPTSSITLQNPMRVVQIPVAGQPGRFVTGFLPVLPPEPALEEPPSRFTRAAKGLSEQYLKMGKPMQIAIGLSAVLFLLGLLGSPFWLFRGTGAINTASIQPPKVVVAHMSLSDVQATATVQADQKNTLLFDPLSTNIHSWTVSNAGPRTFQFKDGMYHIFNNDATGAIAILHDTPPELLNRPLGFSLTLQEVKGDDSSVNNTFGLVIRFTQQRKDGKTVTKFYSFEVVNKKGGEYQFWKYDDSATVPWNSLWKHDFGKEFHQGHGKNEKNTFKIFSDGKKFIISVNGKQVGIVSDGSISSGQVGMLVNLKGTEIAFSNLKLTAK